MLKIFAEDLIRTQNNGTGPQTGLITVAILQSDQMMMNTVLP